jgi:hypothetical protein
MLLVPTLPFSESAVSGSNQENPPPQFVLISSYRKLYTKIHHHSRTFLNEFFTYLRPPFPHSRSYAYRPKHCHEILYFVGGTLALGKYAPRPIIMAFSLTAHVLLAGVPFRLAWLSYWSHIFLFASVSSQRVLLLQPCSISHKVRFSNKWKQPTVFRMQIQIL